MKNKKENVASFLCLLCLQWNCYPVTCKIYLFTSDCIFVSDNLSNDVGVGEGGGVSPFGRLYRHLYSPVPTNFGPTSTFLANASIPSISSTLPSYYSTLYPLPWDCSYNPVCCTFYVFPFQTGKRLWLIFSFNYAIAQKGLGGLWKSWVETLYLPKKLLIFKLTGWHLHS